MNRGVSQTLQPDLPLIVSREGVSDFQRRCMNADVQVISNTVSVLACTLASREYEE